MQNHCSHVPERASDRTCRRQVVTSMLLSPGHASLVHAPTLTATSSPSTLLHHVEHGYRGTMTGTWPRSAMPWTGRAPCWTASCDEPACTCCCCCWAMRSCGAWQPSVLSCRRQRASWKATWQQQRHGCTGKEAGMLQQQQQQQRRPLNACSLKHCCQCCISGAICLLACCAVMCVCSR